MVVNKSWVRDWELIFNIPFAQITFSKYKCFWFFLFSKKNERCRSKKSFLINQLSTFTFTFYNFYFYSFLHFCVIGPAYFIDKISDSHIVQYLNLTIQNAHLQFQSYLIRRKTVLNFKVSIFQTVARTKNDSFKNRVYEIGTTSTFSVQ